MVQTPYSIAVDLGAESGRVMIGTLEGGRLSIEEIHRFANQPVYLPDGLHWNVLQLWSEIKRGISMAVHRSAGAPSSIAVDTWGVDFALLDRQGALLGNPYHYRDSRTDGMVEEAFHHITREDLFEQTGIQTMQLNTLYQLLAMVIRSPTTLKAAEALLTMPDLFHYWLSGEIAVEFTNATTTQCFDPRRRDWSWEVLDQLGIPRHIFRTVREPGSVIGPILPQLCDELGVPAFPVVLPACHDTGSAVVSVPTENRDFAWISSGTWSIMGVEAPEPVITPAMLAYNFTNEGGVFDTWRISKNITGLWLTQECRRAWAQQGENLDYKTMTQLAAQAKPFLAVIDPDDRSFFSPGNMPERICEYCKRTGQQVPQSQGEVLRVALESIALKYRLTLERLEEVIGKHLEPIHIIGGGSRNDLLNQFTADATRRMVIAGPDEATTTGNLLMQGIALGEIANFDEARRIVRASCNPRTFAPGFADEWEAAYAILKKLIQTQESVL